MAWTVKVLAWIGSVLFLMGCVANPAQNTGTASEILRSKGFDVTESLLEPYKRYVNADPLENRVYFQGSDYDDFLLGKQFRLITLTYEPGDDYLIAEFRSMEEDWIFSEYVSVYVGTEKIIDRSPGLSRRTNTSVVDAGNMGSTVYTHEIYRLSISIEDAQKLASADKSQLTVRFGGGAGGYVDAKPHPLANMRGLSAIVSLTDYFGFSANSQDAKKQRPSRAKQALSDPATKIVETKSHLEVEDNQKEPEEEPDEKSEISGLERELASGSIRLIRPGMFKGYGAAAKAARLFPKLAILYEEGLWIRLVETVLEHNFGDNLSYYYLGRAAYEMGYYDAAIKYLNQSIEESKRPLTGKCISCNGVKLPAESELLKAKIRSEN